jgi:hypothetical protein
VCSNLLPRDLCVCVPFGSTAVMESEKNSSISRGLLSIPVSARGLCSMDSMSLAASMNQFYLPTYGPSHVEEMAKLNLDIPRAEQDVEAVRGQEKKEARKALKDLHDARRDLLVRRDLAAQRLVVAFDPAEAKCLFASPIFTKALLNQRDPASSRCGGRTSIFDTAAAMPSETTAASAGVGMFDYFENAANVLRSIELLPDPEFFRQLSPDEKALLYTAHDRVVKFIWMMIASPETQAARLQIEAFDPYVLENASYNDFVSRLVSQKSLASDSDYPTGASRGATVLGAQARPPRRPLKNITCFACGKSGHYQKDCLTAPPPAGRLPAPPPEVADANAAPLSAGELAVFRRMMADGRGPSHIGAVARAAKAAGFDDLLADDDEEADESGI